MADVLFGAFLLALCFYVGKAWLRWFRAQPRLVSPKWRSGVTTFGFSACTVSLVTILLLMLYATVSSSLTPYHPIFGAGLSHHLRDFAAGDRCRDRRKRPFGDADFRLFCLVPSGSRHCGFRVMTCVKGK